MLSELQMLSQASFFHSFSIFFIFSCFVIFLKFDTIFDCVLAWVCMLHRCVFNNYWIFELHESTIVPTAATWPDYAGLTFFFLSSIGCICC